MWICSSTNILTDSDCRTRHTELIPSTNVYEECEVKSKTLKDGEVRVLIFQFQTNQALLDRGNLMTLVLDIFISFLHQYWFSVTTDGTSTCK
jgi:hypothetical protein